MSSNICNCVFGSDCHMHKMYRGRDQVHIAVTPPVYSEPPMFARRPMFGELSNGPVLSTSPIRKANRLREAMVRVHALENEVKNTSEKIEHLLKELDHHRVLLNRRKTLLAQAEKALTSVMEEELSERKRSDEEPSTPSEGAPVSSE